MDHTFIILDGLMNIFMRNTNSYVFLGYNWHSILFWDRLLILNFII